MVSSAGEVLLVGAGGHALVAIEVLQASGHSIAGCIASGARASADLGRLGVSMLGSDQDLEDLVGEGWSRVFIAVGDNMARESLSDRTLACGGSLATAIDPSAHLSPTASVGVGALVMPGAVVTSQASVGTGAIINSSAVVEHECSIGPFAHVAPGSTLGGGVTVGRGALVGIGAAVIPGRRVGDWAVVGAGAVVVRDVPDGTTVVGVPARARRRPS